MQPAAELRLERVMHQTRPLHPAEPGEGGAHHQQRVMGLPGCGRRASLPYPRMTGMAGALVVERCVQRREPVVDAGPDAGSPAGPGRLSVASGGQSVGFGAESTPILLGEREWMVL